MKNEDLLKLENQLCFPIYACSREIIKAYHAPLKALNLTYTQYIVMMVLWEHSGLAVRELGEMLYLDSGTLTPLLKKMEARGLLTRQRSEEDERVVLVQITAEGRALRAQAQAVPQAMACRLPLSDTEAKTLYGLLYKILDGLQKN